MRINKKSQSQFIISKLGKRLHKACVMLSHGDSVFQMVPPIKTPSLKQCYELIARGYGYNTYAGMVESNPKVSEFEINGDKVKKELYDVLISENKQRITVLDYKKLTYDAKNLCKDFEYVMMLENVLSLDRLTQHMNTAKNNYLSLFKLDYGPDFNLKVKIRSEIYIPIQQAIINLMIEKFHLIETFQISENSRVMIALPIKLIYPHKIDDFHYAESILYELSNLLDASFMESHVGKREFITFEDSCVNVVMNRSLYNDIKLASEIVSKQKIWIESFNKVLKAKGIIRDFKTVQTLKKDDLKLYYIIRHNAFIQACENKDALKSGVSDGLNMKHQVGVFEAASSIMTLKEPNLDFVDDRFQLWAENLIDISILDGVAIEEISYRYSINH